MGLIIVVVGIIIAVMIIIANHIDVDVVNSTGAMVTDGQIEVKIDGIVITKGEAIKATQAKWLGHLWSEWMELTHYDYEEEEAIQMFDKARPVLIKDLKQEGLI